MSEQLKLFVDTGAYDQERRRKTRASRHAAKKGRLACGHTPLPTDGEYVQIPITFKALLQVVDCGLCREYLMHKAVQVVIARRVPVCNTGLITSSRNGGDND